VFNVAPDILTNKGLQVIADCNPLVELAKRRRCEESSELRLAQEDDLDELLPTVSRFESIRICSRTLCERFCASSIKRWRSSGGEILHEEGVEAVEVSLLRPRPTSLIPNSSFIVFKSSISERRD